MASKTLLAPNGKPSNLTPEQYKLVRTPAFKAWFGDWENDAANASKVVDENGEPLVVYHGTTHGFNEFTRERGNVQNHFGIGYYFSSSLLDVEENYMSVGPDLTNRIEQLAERIESEKGIDNDEAVQLAKEMLVGGEERIMHVFLNFRNPIVIIKGGGTYFDTIETYDEESEEYSENEDSLPYKIYQAIHSVASDFYGADSDEIWNELSTVVPFYEEQSAYDVDQSFRKLDSILGVENENGELASYEFIRMVYEEAGFDGIIMDADTEFGNKRKVGKKMKMDAGTMHYIGFVSNQIKLADGSNVTFDGSNPDIRYEDGGLVSSINEAMANLEQNGIVLREGGVTLICYNTGGQSRKLGLYNQSLIYKTVSEIDKEVASKIIVKLNHGVHDEFEQGDMPDYENSEHLIVMNQNEVLYHSDATYAKGGDIKRLGKSGNEIKFRSANPAQTYRAVRNWLEKIGIQPTDYNISRTTNSRYIKFTSKTGIEYDIRISDHTRPMLDATDAKAITIYSDTVEIDTGAAQINIDGIKAIYEMSEKYMGDAAMYEQVHGTVEEIALEHFEQVQEAYRPYRMIRELANFPEDEYGFFNALINYVYRDMAQFSQPYKDKVIEAQNAQKKKNAISMSEYTASNGVKIKTNNDKRPYLWQFEYQHLPEMTGKSNRPKRNAAIHVAKDELLAEIEKEGTTYAKGGEVSKFGKGGEIPDRYKDMGFSKVGQKLNSTRPEKKWMVLARKGNQYKVVHGGFKGMEDFSQHKDPERRKRFWDRMGGMDSDKANDAFSPLYWHKKFSTWADGGVVPYTDEHGKFIVYDDGNFYIAVNDEKKADYVTLWKHGVKGKIGTLEAYESKMLPKEYSAKGKFLSIQLIDIHMKYRGNRMANKMYQALLKYSGDDIVGIFSYLPQRTNKKQVPRIYRKYKTHIVDGDYEILMKEDNITEFANGGVVDNAYADGGKIENGVTVGEEMAGETMPDIDTVYDILQQEEESQGGSWLDDEYGDARFDSEEQARAYAQEVYDILSSYAAETEIPVYRAVTADDVDLDPYSIGESWSFSLRSAKNFGLHLGAPVSKVKIISGTVPSENVDWEQAVKNYHLFSDLTDGDSEFELPIPANRIINNVTVSDYKDAKEITPTYANGGVVDNACVEEVVKIINAVQKVSDHYIVDGKLVIVFADELEVYSMERINYHLETFPECHDVLEPIANLNYKEDYRSIYINLKDKMANTYADGGKIGDFMREGASAGMTLADIAQKHKVPFHVLDNQYKKGVKVEMEHTNNREIAEKIAKDHLAENAYYYDMLEVVEFGGGDFSVDVAEFIRDAKAHAAALENDGEMSRLKKIITCKSCQTIAQKHKESSTDHIHQSAWEHAERIWAHTEKRLGRSVLPTKLAAGGIAKGNSHAKGGIPITVKSTGQQIEIEGGEGVVNKRTMQSSRKYKYNGQEKTACEIISDLNQKGGGVKFTCADVKEVISNDGKY